MRGSAEIAKGRVEEAAGALADSDKLRAKGRANQAVGKIKRVIEKEVRQAKDTTGKVARSVRKIAQKAVEKSKAR
jgi:uncharacterized protein YjbJ (UPF0337 family)